MEVGISCRKLSQCFHLFQFFVIQTLSLCLFLLVSLCICLSASVSLSVSLSPLFFSFSFLDQNQALNIIFQIHTLPDREKNGCTFFFYFCVCWFNLSAMLILQGLLENEYTGTSFAVGQVRTISGYQSLRNVYDISPDGYSKWKNLLVLSLMALGYRILAFVLLHFRARKRSFACRLLQCNNDTNNTR